MATDEFYVTRQIAARDDGLSPTRLPSDYSATLHTQDVMPDAPLRVSYETSSKLLNSEIREKGDSSAELEFLCESISNYLVVNVDEEEHQSALTSLDFEIEGCIWKMGLNPNLDKEGEFQVHVTLAGKRDGNDRKSSIWVARTALVYADDHSEVPKSDVVDLPDLKATVDQTALVIRKAIIKCELPEFPEGGKNRRFKEVYKLNAKVGRNHGLIFHVGI